jgi:hypothetical protein
VVNDFHETLSCAWGEQSNSGREYLNFDYLTKQIMTSQQDLPIYCCFANILSDAKCSIDKLLQ